MTNRSTVSRTSGQTSLFRPPQSSTVALSRVLPLHWWATAVRTLPARSPISSCAAIKYRAKMRSCFDGTACTQTTVGIEEEGTLTIIKPRQDYRWIITKEWALFPVMRAFQRLFWTLAWHFIFNICILSFDHAATQDHPAVRQPVSQYSASTSDRPSHTTRRVMS